MALRTRKHLVRIICLSRSLLGQIAEIQSRLPLEQRLLRNRLRRTTWDAVSEAFLLMIDEGIKVRQVPLKNDFRFSAHLFVLIEKTHMCCFSLDKHFLGYRFRKLPGLLHLGLRRWLSLVGPYLLQGEPLALIHDSAPRSIIIQGAFVRLSSGWTGSATSGL